jgi:hypothetical protein
MFPFSFSMPIDSSLTIWPANRFRLIRVTHHIEIVEREAGRALGTP